MLNEAEQRLCRYLAKARCAVNRASGKPNPIIGPQLQEETELEGIGGELAFCKLYQIYPDGPS